MRTRLSERPRSNARVTHPLIIAMCAGLLASCATWKKPVYSALNVTHQAGIAMYRSAKMMCEPTLNDCVRRKTNPCDALDTCHESRKKVIDSIESLQHAILLGTLALEMDNKITAEDAMTVAIKSAEVIQAEISKWKEAPHYVK